MESEIDINGDTELVQLLTDADPADVSVLIDFLADSGTRHQPCMPSASPASCPLAPHTFRSPSLHHLSTAPVGKTTVPVSPCIPG